MLKSIKNQFKLGWSQSILFVVFSLLPYILGAETPKNGKSTFQSIVTGTLIDNETGQVLPGVNVVVKGTNLGTSTNFDGEYSIDVPDEDSVLVFSYIGYTTQEIPLQGRTVLDVTLAANALFMDEVVIVGYGTQKKSQVTGAISKVSAEEIEAVPVITPDMALQGRAAGVDVIAASHEPGAGGTVRIRGINSINASNDPLFVLDGIPISGGLNDINPNTIESMEVLKDASATAIYGSRGSNGVVLITTKRGKSGRTNITYDTYVGFSGMLNKVDVLDADGWVNYKAAALRTDDIKELLDPIELANYNAGNEVDWVDLNTRSGLQMNHSLSVSGGGEKTRFSVNATYTDQEGVVKKSDFKRGSMQINLDHKIGEKVSIGTSTMISHSKANIVDIGRVLTLSMELSPLGDVYNDDGSLRLFPTSEALNGNPLLDVENQERQRLHTRVFSSIYGEYELFKGLKYRLNFGPDFTFIDYGQFIGSNTTTLQGAPNRALNEKQNLASYTLENILMYNRIFNDKHNIGFTLLQSIQEQNTEKLNAEVEGLPSENMWWHDLSSGQIRTYDTDQQKWSILSYMARLNYTFLDKYLLTLTGRVDGSSRFGEDRKYGFFPSAAFAWRIIKEGFMENSMAFSDLKLRLSYGSIGNTAIAPYQTQGSLSKDSYLFGPDPAVGFEPNALPNPDLHWETSTTANFGLDFGLFKNRISGSAEYYIIETSDLLLNRALPTFTGYDNILTNIGGTKNKGFELTISTVNFDNADGFSWTTDVNFAVNRNEITQLYEDGGDDVGNGWFIGEPIDVFYDLQFDGIWQENEADLANSYGRSPGQIRVKDLNNDNQVTAEDRTILGNESPRWTGGMTNTFRYKGFDFSVFINTRQDFMVDSNIHTIDNLAGRFNIARFINYYTPENPSNDYPRPVSGGASNVDMGVLRYRDGSYVRVKNMTLGYNLTNKLMPKTKIQSLRFYVSAQNPFTFTDFEGWDPENGGRLSSYPSTKMYLLGMNAKF